jgi:hypothetical protein
VGWSVGRLKAAQKKYLDQKDDLQAGRRPRLHLNGDGLTIRRLLNEFLNAKQEKVGKVALRTRMSNRF